VPTIGKSSVFGTDGERPISASDNLKRTFDAKIPATRKDNPDATLPRWILHDLTPLGSLAHAPHGGSSNGGARMTKLMARNQNCEAGSVRLPT